VHSRSLWINSLSGLPAPDKTAVINLKVGLRGDVFFPGENIGEKLEQMAMETERVELHQLQIAEYAKLPEIFDKFMEVIEEYGMNPFKGM